MCNVDKTNVCAANSFVWVDFETDELGKGTQGKTPQDSKSQGNISQDEIYLRTSVALSWCLVPSYLVLVSFAFVFVSPLLFSCREVSMCFVPHCALYAIPPPSSKKYPTGKEDISHHIHKLRGVLFLNLRKRYESNGSYLETWLEQSANITAQANGPDGCYRL